jgi:hypothetical protein
MRDPEFAAEYRKVSAGLDAELVVERARRAALKLKHDADDQFAMPVPDEPIVTIWTAVIAAEFGEGER